MAQGMARSFDHVDRVPGESEVCRRRDASRQPRYAVGLDLGPCDSGDVVSPKIGNTGSVIGMMVRDENVV